MDNKYGEMDNDVKYNRSKHSNEWGRILPYRAIGFGKKTPNALIDKNYYDFDLKEFASFFLKNIYVNKRNGLDNI